MSDHGHHDPGGHELEAINTKLLFRLLVSLSFVTFLASAVVVQWFYSQRRELDAQYASDGSVQLKAYKAKMATDLQDLDRVAQEIAGNPALLAAPQAPSGWIHPDDLVSGGVTTPSPTPEHAEPDTEHAEIDEEVEPVPVGLPEDVQAPAEGDEAEGAEAEGDAPKQPKPADGEDAPKPAKQPKPAQPANDGAPDGE